MPALAPSSKRNAPFAPHTRRYAQIRGRSSKSGRVCSARAGIYPSNRRLRLQDWGLPRTRGDTTLLTQVTGNESFAPSHRGYNPAPHSGEHPWSRCEELLSRAHFTSAGVCRRLTEVLLDLTSLMAPHTRNVPAGLRFPDTPRTCPVHAASRRQRPRSRSLTRICGDTTQAELVCPASI